jgi:hypothetical protein
MQTKVKKLLSLAREIAARDAEFHSVKGPGAGDRATSQFMQELRDRAIAEYGKDYAEARLCGENSLAVDYYFPDEETIVEIALGLPNPASEFEKDVLKALMAKELNHKVEHLLFISHPPDIQPLHPRPKLIRQLLRGPGSGIPGLHARRRSLP